METKKRTKKTGREQADSLSASARNALTNTNKKKKETRTCQTTAANKGPDHSAMHLHERKAAASVSR